MPTAYYKSFDLVVVDSTGYWHMAPGVTIDAYDVTGAASLGTLTADAYGVIVAGSFSVAVGSVVEFSHGTYPGLMRITLQATQDLAYTTPDGAAEAFILRNDLAGSTASDQVEVYFTDTAQPTLGAKYLGSAPSGKTTLFPYTTPVAQAAKIYAISRDNLGKLATVDLAYAESATLSVPAMGGGASAFTGLSDVPASYTGATLKVVRVNAAETALEFVTLAGGGDMLAANNLSDLVNAGTARTNLGLGTLATQNGTFSGTHSGTSSNTNTGDQTSIVGISGTKAQFDTAVSDGNIQYVGDAPTAHTHVLANISDAGTMAAQNANAVAITGGTATIDSGGLVVKDTGGSGFGMILRSLDTLTVSNKRFNVTLNDAHRILNMSADLTVPATASVSGTNSGDETAATIGALINGSAAATPNDTDLVGTSDTSVLKKITWTNVKAFLKTYFDTLYQATLVSATNIKTINSSSILGAGDLVVTGSQPDIPLTKIAPAASQTITAGYSAYVVGPYEIVATTQTEIGVGACLEIG